MKREIEALQQTKIFSDLSNDYLEGASLLWELKEIKKEETLWLQGEPANECALIIQGKMKIHINEEDLASVAKGEFIGELAAFTNDTRTASVSTIEDSSLLLLHKDSLSALRTSHPIIFDRLLASALHKVSLRIHNMDREIARIALGESSAPKRKEDNFFQQFFKRLAGSGNRRPPLAESVLRKLPKLKNASQSDLHSILGEMQPHFIEKSKPLFLEGEPGNSVFLLVEGCIDVLRNVKHGMAENLATLYPGALVGTGALLLGGRRNAGCVASKNTDVWVYELNREQHDSLQGNPGRIWKESLLFALAFQLRNANDRWIILKQGTRPNMTDYDKIRSTLLGYQG
jgi:CRP-like cAMP-binding protein